MNRISDNWSNKFGFGVEAEYLLLDKNFRPLFAKDLDFERLRACTDSIPATDLGCEGFNVKPLHKQANPYLIEGYYLTDEDMKPHTLLPKGIEVRTPIRSSIEETISVLADATERLRSRMESEFGYYLCTISHHPTKSNFQAAPNYRRHDYWQWAPLYYVHTEPHLRFEFKGLEMPLDIVDYKAFFLVSLALLLDPLLTLKTSDEERIANLRYFAVHGLESDAARICAKTLLKSAERTALRLSLDASCLSPLWRRLEAGNSPADKISRAFRTEPTLEKTLEHFIVKPAFSAAGVNPLPVNLAN